MATDPPAGGCLTPHTVSTSPGSVVSFVRTASRDDPVPPTTRNVSAAATGEWLTGTTVTATVTVPLDVAPRSSVIVYVKASVPVKPAAGVYVTPAGVSATVPCGG